MVVRQMNLTKKIILRLSDIFGPRLVSLFVLFHGVLIIVLSLVDQLAVHRHRHLNYLSLYISLAVGLTVIYLSSMLGRRKRNALIATSVAYAFYLGASIEGLTDILPVRHHFIAVTVIRTIVLPVVILLLLFNNRRKFVVRSDSQSFRAAIGLSLIILAVTFIYGTIGFYILGKGGFHQSLSVPAAMHYSVDQLNLTTNHPIHAYSDKAVLFSDSLTFVTIFALLYVLSSFVQPLKARFTDQHLSRERFLELLNSQHDANAEDFFKLWPHDKQYFFDSSGKSALAFHVYRGVALVLSGPTGKSARFKQLLSEFQYVCWGNDWRPAIIHADDKLMDMYQELGFSMQQLGEEAVVDLYKFTSSTVKEKYFRNIESRFKTQGYSYELLRPPHHQAVMSRLREISDQWLGRGNHAERGYAMGYFSEEYISMCDVAIARDAAGTIQAFLNLVPAKFDTDEATYDMLRSSNKALGNINDFLLIKTMQSLYEQGYQRLNLGFTPLVGLAGEQSKGLIGSVLSFAYANGDRFYSFSGLYRFKNKYQPDWKPRYVFYQGGVRGFSKIMNSLMRTMTVTAKARYFKRPKS
ncbi:MAG: bifunctional lysylphosphatidylglycerol flippase/synthetase MprF [Candidatus Saccharimonadales bacterium]